jgi:hypothetical protein
MFAAFNQPGPAICPSGWLQSLLGDNFADGVALLFGCIADGGGAAPTGVMQESLVCDQRALLPGRLHRRATGSAAQID